MDDRSRSSCEEYKSSTRDDGQANMRWNDNPWGVNKLEVSLRPGDKRGAKKERRDPANLSVLVPRLPKEMSM